VARRLSTSIVGDYVRVLYRFVTKWDNSVWREENGRGSIEHICNEAGVLN